MGNKKRVDYCPECHAAPDHHTDCGRREAGRRFRDLYAHANQVGDVRSASIAIQALDGKAEVIELAEILVGCARVDAMLPPEGTSAALYSVNEEEVFYLRLFVSAVRDYVRKVGA